jgi:hypothetical protein
MPLGGGRRRESRQRRWFLPELLFGCCSGGPHSACHFISRAAPSFPFPGAGKRSLLFALAPSIFHGRGTLLFSLSRSLAQRVEYKKGKRRCWVCVRNAILPRLNLIFSACEKREENIYFHLAGLTLFAVYSGADGPVDDTRDADVYKVRPYTLYPRSPFRCNLPPECPLLCNQLGMDAVSARPLFTHSSRMWKISVPTLTNGDDLLGKTNEILCKIDSLVFCRTESCKNSEILYYKRQKEGHKIFLNMWWLEIICKNCGGKS